MACLRDHDDGKVRVEFVDHEGEIKDNLDTESIGSSLLEMSHHATKLFVYYSVAFVVDKGDTAT